MLQRMQAEIGELFRLRMGVDRYHPALFTKFVERKHLVIGLCKQKTGLLGDPQDNRNAFSSAPSYNSSSSEIDAETTVWPSSLISSLSDLVSPIFSAESPYFTAISWIRGTFPGSHEITTRLASSPKSTNSGGSSCEERLTIIPTPFLKPHSAKVTPKPPSEQSCADSRRPVGAISTSAFCRAASFSISISGGYPQSAPRISFAYSE